MNGIIKAVSLLVVTFLVGIILNACKKGEVLDDKTMLPRVITGNPVISGEEIILSGEVTFTDGESGTKRGLCWSLNSNPTTDDQFYLDTATGKGPFNVDVKGQIEPNKNYYIRAFAENSAGLVYGDEVILYYRTATEIPKVTTKDAVISDSVIILTGDVTFTDGDNNTTRGICWAESPSPTTDDQHYTDTATGEGIYKVNVIKQLKPNTTYYVRAFAENSFGKNYGNEVNFKTSYFNPKQAFINSRGCIQCEKYEVGDTFTLQGTDFIVADYNMIDSAHMNYKDLSIYCTSKIENMEYLLSGPGLILGSIVNWDVSNVKWMQMMFDHNSNFNQDIGNWDVSNVEDMHQMFHATVRFNQDLSNWCVKKITKAPTWFSYRSSLSEENHPVWGTCPE